MDAVIAVLVVGCFWIAFRNIGLWKWFWIGLAIYLGIFEGVSVLITHRTISQQFWAYMQADPVGGYFAGGLIILGGIGLAMHLWWKQLKGRLDQWRRR